MCQNVSCDYEWYRMEQIHLGLKFDMKIWAMYWFLYQIAQIIGSLRHKLTDMQFVQDS